VVGYLVLGDPPHLRGRRCAACGATYVERRNGGREFDDVALPSTGTLRTFTVVHRGARGEPFVSGVVELTDGTVVKSNIVDAGLDPDALPLGGPVELVTRCVGTDKHGTEAVAFAFRPTGA
jgi:uncharacterized OB-fold protein